MRTIAFDPSTITIFVHIFLWYSKIITAFTPSVCHSNSCFDSVSRGDSTLVTLYRPQLNGGIISGAVCCSSWRRFAKSDASEDEDYDDDDEIDLSDRDWRDFRAQLVMSSSSSETNDEDEVTSSPTAANTDDDVFEDDLDGIGSLYVESQPPLTTKSPKKQQNRFETEAMSKSNFTPLEPSQWAYESGKVIEKGAVILGGVEQDYGFGLRQQYFHKSVILVLDHDESFTKGIILNRPSDVVLNDEAGEYSDGVVGGQWRIWFGGDVQGLDSVLPEIVCLHSIRGDDDVDSVSKQVMKNIKWTTFEDAKALVAAKKATPSDFWVFAGYAGWGPGQLLGELDRKSWYMCATDSQTLLLELARQSAHADPRDAGLDTWELLMTMIGRESTAEECSGDFEDLMLKEWAREHLVKLDALGNSLDAEKRRAKDLVDKMLGRFVSSGKKSPTTRDGDKGSGSEGLTVGSVVRASSAERSPFLLRNQEYHKSLVLVIGDQEYLTAGVILNQPSPNAIEVELLDQKSGNRSTIKMPIRYGGPYAFKGEDGEGQLLWLHESRTLRAAGIGRSVGGEDSLIQRCTQEEAIEAISDGLARPTDFLVVAGISVWQGFDKGMKWEVRSGRFEMVDPSRIQPMWQKLKKQDVLTKMNLLETMIRANEAWEASGYGENDSSFSSLQDDGEPVTDGIGEGFDEEDDSLVFKTDVQVSKLSDDALRSWVATFLLGAPTLGA